MTFIMGPSGAGKTSLLDALAGRLPRNMVSGCVKVNGAQRKPWQFRAISEYVEQVRIVVLYTEDLQVHLSADCERRRRGHDSTRAVNVNVASDM
jgi:ABC-type multidrug transport system ATPase subunit